MVKLLSTDETERTFDGPDPLFIPFQQIIETEHLMEHVVNGLSDPVTKVQLAAVRCLHSLSRSVQQLRTSFQDHAVWKPLMKVQSLTHSVTHFLSHSLIQSLTHSHSYLTRLPPRDSTPDGRWTRKPFRLSRVQPIYLSIPRLERMGRTSNSRLRGPGFESCAVVLNPWASFFHSTLHQITQLYK